MNNLHISAAEQDAKRMSNEVYIPKDSGHRREFASGAKRDRPVGKGRYDLLPPVAIKRLAKVLEGGAIKYEARNYEKGMPLCQFIDSALRHIFQYLEGMRDEDHMGQAFWNIMAFIHTEEMINRGLLPIELNDLPNYLPKLPDKTVDISVKDISKELSEQLRQKQYCNCKLPQNDFGMCIYCNLEIHHA